MTLIKGSPMKKGNTTENENTMNMSLSNYTDRVQRWNELNGLVEFDLKNEVAYTLSEELELLDFSDLAEVLFVGFTAMNRNKEAQTIAKAMKERKPHDALGYALIVLFIRYDVTDAEYFDKCLDQEVFNIGGMSKALKSYGLDQRMIHLFRSIVMSANEAKPIGKKTDKGKQEKGEGFEKIDPIYTISEILKNNSPKI